VGCYPPQPVSVLGPATTLTPSFLLAQAIFELGSGYIRAWLRLYSSLAQAIFELGSGYIRAWLRLYSSQTSPRINTPTFSNLVILHTYPPMKMEQTECSETSAYKIQTPGNYPEENIQHTEHGESLKSRICNPF